MKLTDSELRALIARKNQERREAMSPALRSLHDASDVWEDEYDRYAGLIPDAEATLYADLTTRRQLDDLS